MIASNLAAPSSEQHQRSLLALRWRIHLHVIEHEAQIVAMRSDVCCVNRAYPSADALSAPSSFSKRTTHTRPAALPARR